MRKKIVEKYRVQFEQLKNEVYELLYYIFKMDTIDGIDELHLSDEELEKGLEEIVAAIGDEHILSATKLTEFAGPQDIHNENRVFADGKGSFKLATKGLKKGETKFCFQALFNYAF